MTKIFFFNYLNHFHPITSVPCNYSALKLSVGIQRCKSERTRSENINYRISDCWNNINWFLGHYQTEIFKLNYSTVKHTSTVYIKRFVINQLEPHSHCYSFECLPKKKIAIGLYLRSTGLKSDWNLVYRVKPFCAEGLLDFFYFYYRLHFNRLIFFTVKLIGIHIIKGW